MASESRRKEDTANIVLKIIIHMREYWQAWTVIVALMGAIAWMFNAARSVNVIPSLEARVSIVETKVQAIEEIKQDVRDIRNAVLNHRRD